MAFCTVCVEANTSELFRRVYYYNISISSKLVTWETNNKSFTYKMADGEEPKKVGYTTMLIRCLLYVLYLY